MAFSASLAARCASLTRRISDRFLKRKHLKIDDLFKMSSDELLKLQWDYNFFAGFWTRGGISLTPVVDGKYIPMPPDKACETGETARVPYLIDSTKNDMGVSKAGITDMSKSKMHTSLMRWAAIHTSQGIPSYSYHFEWLLPGDKAGAFHSSELWYVFGTLGRSWRPMRQEDFELSECMVGTWTKFIKTGDPGWDPCVDEKGFCHIFL